MAVGVYGDVCVGGHRAFIADRGGKRAGKGTGQLLDLSQVKWNRARDKQSESTIRVEGAACSAQQKLLERIEPKRSELVIYRGKSRVWEGPVNRVTWGGNYVEINAHDIFEYFLGTPLTQEWSNRGVLAGPVTTRVATIVEAEMAIWESLSPPANIVPHFFDHHFDNEARTTALTVPFEMSVGEHIQSLARSSGIDFTVVGRALHVWDVSRYLGRTRTMTEKDFLAPPVVTAYGSDFAAKSYVIGSNGVYGEAGTTDPYYGPWTKIFTNYNEEGTEAPTQSELNSQASRNLVGRNPVPVEVRIPDNTGIRLDDVLTIEKLTPGVQVPLRARLNARKMTQMQRLDQLTVTETAAGETVQVVLLPATRPDSDEII